MKNYREYFVECFDAEKPKFVRVLRAIPDGQEGYKPHPRSTSTGDLAWLLASELRDACELIDHGEVNFELRPCRTSCWMVGTRDLLLRLRFWRRGSVAGVERTHAGTPRTQDPEMLGPFR